MIKVTVVIVLELYNIFITERSIFQSVRVVAEKAFFPVVVLALVKGRVPAPLPRIGQQLNIKGYCG